MPPQRALFLCILFVLYVYKLDFDRKYNISNVLWVPLIWMIINVSKPVGQFLNSGGVTTTDAYMSGNPIDRTILIILMVIGLNILSKRRTYCLQKLRSNLWILLFLLYCGVSILWADFPGVSFKRWIKGIGSLMMVLMVLSESDPAESFKTLIRRCAYVVIPFSILLIKYYRRLGVIYSPWGGGAMYAGVATSKNSLGRLCLICGFYFFWNMFEMWRNKKLSLDKKGVFVNLLFLFMILWLLKKADSATSMGTLIVGVFTFIGLGISFIKGNVKNIGVFIISTISIFLILGLSLNLAETIVSSMGRNLTLTDRTELWSDLLKFNTDPLIGTGYGSFWLGDRLAILWEKWWWKPNNSHNGYLEIYLELGLIGLFLLIGVLFEAYRKIRRTLILDFEFGRFQLGFFFMFLLYNITEPSFKLRTPMWFVFLLIALYSPKLSDSDSIGNCY